MSNRIHCFGASGSGTSTLAQALADAIDVPHIDADDAGWKQTEPPYIERNEIEERIRLRQVQTKAADSWVLSGSLWTHDITISFPIT
jgi:adenylate kinase family enzyme|tara:strand:- start:125 stop:385 length:261 start_codon:yes stop_codon:yes gene_type:complete